MVFFGMLLVSMYSPLNLFGYWTLNKHYYHYYYYLIDCAIPNYVGCLKLIMFALSLDDYYIIFIHVPAMHVSSTYGYILLILNRNDRINVWHYCQPHCGCGCGCGLVALVATLHTSWNWLRS